MKESVALQGMPHSAGLVARAELRAGRTAPAVQGLIDAGAIALGVTNTSELTLWIESENRLYGRTSNPYDASRTAGGSSGGEGAAVGAGGSVFGVASDIAGSIRIPAFFCGVFGHKPSPGDRLQRGPVSARPRRTVSADASDRPPRAPGRGPDAAIEGYGYPGSPAGRSGHGVSGRDAGDDGRERVAAPDEPRASRCPGAGRRCPCRRRRGHPTG